MLDCIHQLQLTLKEHVLLNSKQAEYQMSQNADLFSEMIKGQTRRDLDPAMMAIPAFTGEEPKKCLDWINRIKNICSQAGHLLRQELMNKSEPVVQNFIKMMGDTWTDKDIIDEILKYFSDIPTPAHAITKLRTLIQGEEEAIVMYNQKYRMLVERVEGKPVEKIDSYVELEQYLGSVILPIRKSIQNNIYWKSKHAPRTLGEAMIKGRRIVHEAYLCNRRNTQQKGDFNINGNNNKQNRQLTKTRGLQPQMLEKQRKQQDLAEPRKISKTTLEDGRKQRDLAKSKRFLKAKQFRVKKIDHSQEVPTPK